MSDAKPIAYAAYQELADRYAAMIDHKPHNAYYDRPAMLSLLPDVHGVRVLDVGCGPGAYAAALVDRGAHVTSCDVSDRMLELAAERLAPAIAEGRVTLHNVDLTQPLTLFESSSFGVVLAPLCLDYIEDWRALFEEFRRVLEPGGTFLFSCGHPAFDAEYFETEDYFSVEEVEATWTGFGKAIVVPSYRRSLEEMVAPVLEAGFHLRRVHEPLPTEDFKKADPVRHARLMHRPAFLCVVASSPGATI